MTVDLQMRAGDVAHGAPKSPRVFAESLMVIAGKSAQVIEAPAHGHFSDVAAGAVLQQRAPRRFKAHVFEHLHRGALGVLAKTIEEPGAADIHGVSDFFRAQILARVGLDEFACALQVVGDSALANVAQVLRVVARLAQQQCLDQGRLQVSGDAREAIERVASGQLAPVKVY